MSVKVRLKKISGGRSHLYLDISKDGYRKKDYLKLYTFDNPKDQEERRHNKQVKELARQYALDRERQMVTVQRGGVIESNMTFDKVYQLRISFVSNQNTLNNYQYMFEAAQRLGIDKISISHIDRYTCERLMKLLSESLKESTANERYNKFSTVMNYAVKEGIIGSNPATFIEKKKVEEKDIRYLEESELKQLASVKPDGEEVEVMRAFLFSCYTGLRISDIRRLDWSMIEGDRLTMVQKKTTDRVYLPLNSTALRLLGERKHGKVFSDNLTTSRIDWHLKKLATKAGLSKSISFHVARHTFATWLITRGVDIYTVQQLMGHKNINSTMRYAKVISEKKRQSVERLPDILQ
ncbi:tyrosine-type recombinase/integrase [Limibacter armeniacum]|uniref:tyrosine-type recombinase/integrase n=1 Tax=Limibacter armeniacum TaxID=466084 RepID=UPI002FE5197E